MDSNCPSEHCGWINQRPTGAENTSSHVAGVTGLGECQEDEN